MTYSDKEKNEIAWEEYTSYKIGDKAKYGEQRKMFGYVSDIFSGPTGNDMKDALKDKESIQSFFKRAEEEKFGLDGYVITDKKVGGNVKPEDVTEITVLFQGSEVDFSSFKGVNGSINDWGFTDTQMAANILRSRYLGINKGVAKQQKLAAEGLKK